MTNPEIQWHEVAPESTPEECEQEFYRMAHNPAKDLPKAFFDAAENLLDRPSELSNKEDLLAEE